jgi:hypothetical protein
MRFNTEFPDDPIAMPEFNLEGVDLFLSFSAALCDINFLSFTNCPPPPVEKMLPILPLLSSKDAEGDIGGVGARSVENVGLLFGVVCAVGFKGVPAGD